MSNERMFTQLTERLLREKRVTGFYLQHRAEPPTAKEEQSMDIAFSGKQAAKGDGKIFLWHDWLVESLFPTTLYKQNGCDLRRLAKDKRVWDIAGFSGNWNNSFGRMARPRDKLPEGFVLWMLDRWAGKYRGMPQYYFNVEEPEWVCEPLAGRPDIPKTSRTAVSCVMNYGFHWLNDEAHISVILRHLNWSHGWGDVYGGDALLTALCKEVGCPKGNVTIFANSASMDEPKIAKAYLKEMQGAK